MVLSILCDFKEKNKQMVEILSTNRNLEKNVRKGEEMLTVDIEKMPSFNIGFDRGIQKGIENGVKKVALGMLKLNLDMEIIQKSTGLSLEEIESLTPTPSSSPQPKH